MLQERLEEAFQYFGWVRIPDILHQHAEEAAQQNIPYTTFLDKLLQEEIREKRSRFVQMRTKMAHLPFQKSLETLDFSFQPSIDEKRMKDLATLRFVEHQENLIFLGPPVGKSHLAVALAYEALRRRYTVYFVTAHDLVQSLQLAYQNHTIKQQMRTFTKPDLLILVSIYNTISEQSAVRFSRSIWWMRCICLILKCGKSTTSLEHQNF
ncbi:ATP-binding protein [Paenibacillus chitinolyticus]|uniref:ATP-binding protein n=1 Tax=Paenibacillus chitinolyticus TaxID=79263 RepID=UPI00295E3B11|nr:ATP-binding protein [Paenibacillus chitinolyticus]